MGGWEGGWAGRWWKGCLLERLPPLLITIYFRCTWCCPYGSTCPVPLPLSLQYPRPGPPPPAGGSATASEAIHREVALLRRAGKTVVVSMGNAGKRGERAGRAGGTACVCLQGWRVGALQMSCGAELGRQGN